MAAFHPFLPLPVLRQLSPHCRHWLIGYFHRMDTLATDARRLADELRASNPKPDSVERYLLNALEPFVRTLEADGCPQRGSTDALLRFCVDSLEWSSPLYRRCIDLVEQPALVPSGSFRPIADINGPVNFPSPGRSSSLVNSLVHDVLNPLTIIDERAILLIAGDCSL